MPAVSIYRGRLGLGILICAVLWLAAAAGAAAQTLGTTTIGPSSAGLVANAKRVNPYRLNWPGTVSELECVAAGSFATQIPRRTMVLRVLPLIDGLS